MTLLVESSLILVLKPQSWCVCAPTDARPDAHLHMIHHTNQIRDKKGMRITAVCELL